MIESSPIKNTSLGCDSRWWLIIGDSVTRGTYLQMIDKLKHKYLNLTIKEIGQNLNSSKETHWRDIDTHFYHEKDEFKLSLRFLTSAEHKLPAILENLTMLHGGHHIDVELLPELALPGGPASPDLILFNIGFWPLVSWKDNELSLHMDAVWKLLHIIPKHLLRIFTLTEIIKHPVIQQEKVNSMNQLIVEYANQNMIPLIDAAIITKGFADGFHLNSQGYDELATSIFDVLCWKED